MPEPLESLIEEAQMLVSRFGCLIDDGHLWATDGGRACPHPESIGEGHCSQPVYRCSRCGEYDHGDPGGPGHAECMRCPLQHLAADRSWWAADGGAQ